MESSTALFPLEKVDEAHFQELCQTLWQWGSCDACTAGHQCGIMSCPWRRWKRLNPFFQFYKACTASYVPELLVGTHPALSGHEDLLNIISLLQDKSTTPREILMEQYLATLGENSQPEESDMHRAFNLAVKVMTMVTCSGENQPADLFSAGSAPVEWRNGDSLAQFFESAFPIRDHPTLNEKDEGGVDIKSQLKAVQLQSIAGLKFRGTDNLRDHLRMNQETGIVDLYHHTSVLKEHLNMRGPDGNLPATTGNTQRSVSWQNYISHLDKRLPSNIFSSIIPRQLALETLDSLQKILFPMDEDSQRLLRSLVSKQNLDPDCLRFETTIDRADDEHDMKYQHWGSRLMDLYDEIENPKPRGLFQRWMERKSGDRHVMMATLAGVMIAVVLGLLGLAVSIFQAWVGYQQWKHPVTV